MQPVSVWPAPSKAGAGIGGARATSGSALIAQAPGPTVPEAALPPGKKMCGPLGRGTFLRRLSRPALSSA